MPVMDGHGARCEPKRSSVRCLPPFEEPMRHGLPPEKIFHSHSKLKRRPPEAATKLIDSDSIIVLSYALVIDSYQSQIVHTPQT